MGAGRGESGKTPIMGQEEDGEEGCSLSMAANLFSPSLSWDCALTAELFYQQILDLKIAAVSASEVEQGYQTSCWGWGVKPPACSRVCPLLHSACGSTLKRQSARFVLRYISRREILFRKGARCSYIKPPSASLCQGSIPPAWAGGVLDPDG